MSASSANNWTSTGEPNQTTGQFHSVKGTVVETIGNMTGATSWQQSGKEEHAAGEAEYNAARAKGYVEGGIDRITGKKDSIVGAVTGDKSQQAEGNVRHDKGQAQQDLNRNL
ncbi:mismatched base pair and cruciform DNA recognition protein [Mycena latifolia]|nr:mismatched base pair and cruciform DNA recognition protein [Mycena latifolia]